METIKNVSIGDFDIDSIVLGTTGVSSCIAAIVELENKVFIYHVDPKSFNATSTCSRTDAHTFLMNIFNHLYQLIDSFSIIKNVCLIGGWKNIGYMILRNQVDIIREDYTKTMNQNRTLLHNNFHRFVNAIKLNLIGFNIPPKAENGINNEPNDDDSPYDYIFGCTIVYGRSSSSSTFAIWQYGGQEHEMSSDRRESLLLAIYVDGNGLISKGLARKIGEQLDYLIKYEQNELYPSAYQIRMADCKGIVIIDSESTLNQFYIKIRQCFIRYQVVDDNGKPLKNPEFKTVVGPVIITKNPCPYAGDIMTLKAVDLPELDCLKDAIVFSTKGNRPDCNKIAGSDLDGDQYFVYWGQELRISETIEPFEYKPQLPSDRSTPITANGVVNYCLSLLGATSHGEIYNLHAIVVDQNKEKHPKRTCQKLAIEMAAMFSAAIDSGKTGYQTDTNRIKEIRKIVGYKYPDFLMKTLSYQSESILGIIYRKALNFKTQNPQLFEGQDINDSINTSTRFSEKYFRFYVRVCTVLKIDPDTIHHELHLIFGNNAPFKIIIDRWSDYYKKKDTNTTQSIESSTNTSTEDIKEVCSQMDNNLHITDNEIQENVNMNSDTNEKAKALTEN
ncbi:unnamed protein product [Rotaria sp. Silwood2]|nr:unnamed protein product [Rotaria sp. Silwood2]